MAFALLAATACAKQGAVRTLYTAPNTAFVEQPSGETVITVNDTSGSIATLQAEINNARSANPGNVIAIHLLRGAIYTVSDTSLTLSSHECLVAEGAIFRAANSSITVPLITIAAGSTNVSVAGGTFDGQGANIQAIYAPSAARVNIDKVVVKNFGSDGVFLNGNGNTAFDNEITVTRADVSTSAVGIHIQNSTQTTLLDNNCHDNGSGILVSAAWANVANNTCHNNITGIDIAGGNDNIVANNTCDNNGTGIHVGATKNMVVSNALGGNTTAGITSNGTSNNFIDNLFTSGNATNFISNGTSDNIIAYQSPISASGENYFYPPLIDNQHTDPTIVNGMGRTDLTISSTTIDDVQNQYNAARTANPNNVIVLHLNGTFTVGANPLKLSSNTSVLLNGAIQINSSTKANTAVSTSASGQTRISISGGTLDGGNLNGHTGISASNASMIQVDGMTIQNFGDNSSHHSGSDSIHFTGGTTPYAVTRCTINKSGARGIWSQLNHQKALYADNSVVQTRACIDADSHTFGSVMMFNFCDSNTYGLFIEQGAAHNTAIGNVSNNSARKDITVFNNNDTPAVEFNSIISNTISGGSTGIQSGSTPAGIFTSSNFFFNNVVLNTSIQSQLSGAENYYSQNYLLGGTLSTSGAETFFNSADVSGNLQIRDSNSGLAVVAQNASTADGAAIVTFQPSPMGNGTNDDEWQFIPTSNGYYRIVNGNSSLVMAVQGAALSSGAPVIQTAYIAGSTNNGEWLIQPNDNGLYNLVNRLSGLSLDVPDASTTEGTQLDQASASGAANQLFSLVEDAPLPIPTITLSGQPDTNVTYGTPSTVNVSISGAQGPGTGTISYEIDGGASTTLTLSNGAASITVGVLPVGAHTVAVTYNGSIHNIAATQALTLTVNPAPLTVTADNITAVYGSPLPAFTGSITGAVNGDTFSASFSSDAGTNPSVGSYTITPAVTGSNLSNYTVTINPGVLTITPAPLTVNVDNAMRQYGSPDPAFTGTILGIVNNDAITATYSSTDSVTSPVGTYPITASLSGAALSNYTVTVNPGTLTITPAPLTVNIQSATRLYGSINPIFQANFTGLLNGDTLGFSGSAPATVTSDVGNYPITGAITGAAAANYNISFNNGTLTITPAPLVIAVANAIRQYGTPNPIFTGTIVGLLNSDPLIVTYSTVATPLSSVGSYPIVASVTGPANKLADYTIMSQPGVLTITSAALVITANDQTKVLHAPNPDLTVSYSGFLAGDTPAQLGGTLTCSTTATLLSPVGSYPITCSGQTSLNYVITYVPGTLKVLYLVGACPVRDQDDDRPQLLSHAILPPINTDGSSIFHSNGDVPVRFRVCDANGNSMGSPGTVTSFVSLNGPQPSTQRRKPWRFNGEDNDSDHDDNSAQDRPNPHPFWQFNLELRPLPSGTYNYLINLNDGTNIPFSFTIDHNH